MEAEPAALEIEEMRARILRTSQEADKFAAETQKLIAEMEKFRGELKFQPWSTLFQGALAATAVVGAGIAIASCS